MPLLCQRSKKNYCHSFWNKNTYASQLAPVIFSPKLCYIIEYYSSSQNEFIVFLVFAMKLQYHLCKTAATPNALASGSRTAFLIASSHQPAIKKAVLRHCLQEPSPFHRKIYGCNYFQERSR